MLLKYFGSLVLCHFDAIYKELTIDVENFLIFYELPNLNRYFFNILFFIFNFNKSYWLILFYLLLVLLDFFWVYFLSLKEKLTIWIGSNLCPNAHDKCIGYDFIDSFADSFAIWAWKFTFCYLFCQIVDMPGVICFTIF